MGDPSLIEALRTNVTAKLTAVQSDNEADLASSRVAAFAERPPSLHHYTTADGVLGIITNKVMYATSAEFLNDYSEVLYGLTMARESILDTQKTIRNSFEHSFLSSVLKQLEKTNVRSHFHTICFCETRDLLSQWRGYGANGGYSLDFQNVELFELKPRSQQEFVKVLYNRVTQKQLLETFIRRYHIAYRELFGLDKDFSVAIRVDEPRPPALVEMDRIVSAFLGELVYLSLFFKSPTFEEENEWRLLTYLKSHEVELLKFRSVRGLLIPYLEIPIQITESSLASITCGPSPHGALTKISVGLLLERHGLHGVPVLGSEIPLKL